MLESYRLDGSEAGSPAKILLIDNYDSFTYNLVQAFAAMGACVTVWHNDEHTVQDALRFAPTHLVVSPGPGRPEDAGISLEVLRAMTGLVPVLGVCLGHQALGLLAGGRIVRAIHPMHGKTSACFHDASGVFSGLAQGFVVGRYHSLVIAPESLGADWRVTAHTQEGEIMGIAHRTEPTFGVQFHPESILTPLGERLLANFIHRAHTPH